MSLPEILPGTDDVRVWADLSTVENTAQQQLRNVASLPWVVGVRSMPDVHTGYGVPIGSVIAMDHAVSAAAVGVDVGCGMTAVQTNLMLSDLPDDLAGLRSRIEQAVPTGFHAFDGHSPLAKSSRDHALANRFTAMMQSFDDLEAAGIGERQSRAAAQCGTLGGGNHFIELCRDDNENIWIQLHSGSRNIGKELADRHIAVAKTLPHNAGLADPNLAVFLSGTPQMDAYLHDLWWAQDYALLNRDLMMAAVQQTLNDWLGRPATFLEPIRCHHNYVALERLSDGTEVVITRKGAIAAHAGQLGVIPGSMGTGSFIVRGLGNEASYWSASHGAGRTMSRTKAKGRFTLADLAAQTAGVECRKDAGVLDEAPGAYKDLGQVMAQQADLVEPVARLTTLLCVKG